MNGKSVLETTFIFVTFSSFPSFLTLFYFRAFFFPLPHQKKKFLHSRIYESMFL